MIKCPNCGDEVIERKSRSKGAKDRYRCVGARRRTVEDYEHHTVIKEWYEPSCGLFGIKDIEQKNEVL
ncbi:hypothetical protein A6046_05145 [[Haemophilus] ducreyi]|uniref:Uncharacterized protein n=2 Tax=Haemophilus ducreyi TaxID=730 RepID=Q7VNL5_HAEDU|nr:hypothetical protein [[Haemophilus] ducreyi]AAP95444.1 hypothetical protein HD_0494 [[Haemophilus] ducreyi 35000HP]AKO30549.1 hypothetical protein RY60_01940 [[Haemophilus] ducreyi]AKO31986.1 hypothetical protein RZ57_01945 [[Haemophilus] ducreyi]AKO33441.1 hypothetical protein RZ58_01945 [[Haemophilus] ducreyi]AKO34888.1 hypothetical protein RZ59_01930 [[Haemophilus] ducreyi]